MLGIVVLAAFELFGVLQAWRLFSRRGRTVRLWLGMVMGLMEMMWLPSLFALALDFTLPAQRLALLTSALAAVGCAFIRPGERPLSEGEAKEEPPLWLILCLVVPAMLVSGYLQYTHMFREVDGALYVGQSTYGDLCMHASFATGLIGQSYPPEYSILPGTRLGYPFLVDALSATMLIYGTPLAAAFSVPGTLMTGLIWLGFVLFTWEMTGKKSAVVIAFVLLFFNGGLGFLGTLDRVTSDPTALNDALNGGRMIVESLHVSREFRHRGLGRALFERALGEARARGASCLYISACSSRETIAFYRAMGCVLADQVIPELAEEEPFDLQLTRPAG